LVPCRKRVTERHIVRWSRRIGRPDRSLVFATTKCRGGVWPFERRGAPSWRSLRHVSSTGGARRRCQTRQSKQRERPLRSHESGTEKHYVRFRIG
jgi:hypothetical protein